MTQPIKFFENKGEGGLTQVSVSPEQFRVAVGEDGTVGKMKPGKDIYQHRKRERIILWKKFANYMIAYGRDEAAPAEEAQGAGVMSPGQRDTTAELVTFYQRFGDVGCWVFHDGHLQVRPHGEGPSLQLSRPYQDGARRDGHLVSLLAPAARGGRETCRHGHASVARSARASTSRKRPEIDPDMQGIPAANDFRRKVEFVRNVVREWVANGGLGNSSMSRETRLRWTGFRETVNVAIPQKHVWVTIGARWGDQRLSTYVDPRKPWELGDEVDGAKR
ncbi:serine/threonine protein kinase [Ophiocordyceps sinensis CO18]|uniref:Serine/threonine protein kinase n=1 Tax=Ophiocordyceps sinensis (strain Co18 / CGMCC 3.14243) TaxID=911162 RepID=T5A6R3_OPHSC|nr:serine/threonine protein kinase [Ophiocordyceps sinensis CO18]